MDGVDGKQWQAQMTDVTVRGGLMKGLRSPWKRGIMGDDREWRNEKLGDEEGLSGHIWQWTRSIWIVFAWWLLHTKHSKGYTNSHGYSLGSLYLPYSIYNIFSVYIMFGFLGPLSRGTGWKQASRPGAEWRLAARGAQWESEDRNTHRDTGQCILLNGFKTPVEWPLFH